MKWLPSYPQSLTTPANATWRYIEDIFGDNHVTTIYFETNPHQFLPAQSDLQNSQRLYRIQIKHASQKNNKYANIYSNTMVIHVSSRMYACALPLRSVKSLPRQTPGVQLFFLFHTGQRMADMTSLACHLCHLRKLSAKLCVNFSPPKMFSPPW